MNLWTDSNRRLLRHSRPCIGPANAAPTGPLRIILASLGKRSKTLSMKPARIHLGGSSGGRVLHRWPLEQGTGGVSGPPVDYKRARPSRTDEQGKLIPVPIHFYYVRRNLDQTAFPAFRQVVKWVTWFYPKPQNVGRNVLMSDLKHNRILFLVPFRSKSHTRAPRL